MPQFLISLTETPEGQLGLGAGAAFVLGLVLLAIGFGLGRFLSAGWRQGVIRLGAEIACMAIVVLPVGFLFLNFNPDRKWETARGLAIIVPFWVATRIYRLWRPSPPKAGATASKSS